MCKLIVNFQAETATGLYRCKANLSYYTEIHTITIIGLITS